MRIYSQRGSTRRWLAATALLCLACSLAGGGGGSALPSVLRESEVLVRLPQGTRVVRPGSPAILIDRPEGAWLVDAGYLSRIHALLGLDGDAARPSP